MERQSRTPLPHCTLLYTKSEMSKCSKNIREYRVTRASDWLRGGPTRQSCRAVSPNGQAAATDQLRPRQRRRADARRLNPKVHIFPRRLLDDWRQAADNGAVSQARVSSERSVSGGTYGAAFSSNLSSRQTHRRRPLSLPWLATASRPAWDFFSAPLVTAAPFTLGALTLRYVLWRKGRREGGGVQEASGMPVRWAVAAQQPLLLRPYPQSPACFSALYPCRPTGDPVHQRWLDSRVSPAVIVASRRQAAPSPRQPHFSSPPFQISRRALPAVTCLNQWINCVQRVIFS